MLPKHWSVFPTLAIYQLRKKDQYKDKSWSKKIYKVKYTKTNTMKKKMWVQWGSIFVGMLKQKMMAAKYDLYWGYRGLSFRETYKEFSKFCPIPTGNMTLLLKQVWRSNMGN